MGVIKVVIFNEVQFVIGKVYKRKKGPFGGPFPINKSGTGES